jgi:hypothetical protein
MYGIQIREVSGADDIPRDAEPSASCGKFEMTTVFYGPWYLEDR